MQAYLDLLRKVLDEGVERDDRCVIADSDPDAGRSPIHAGRLRDGRDGIDKLELVESGF